MKITLLILMLLIASITTAQDFQLTSSVSQGVVINRDFEADLFNATIQVTPSFVFDKWKFSGVAMSYSMNNETGFFGGSQVSYQVLPYTYISAQALFGNTGKELYGGGVGYDFPDVTIFGNAGYETKAEETWLEVGIGYNIIE
jgi:hypothetical protein